MHLIRASFVLPATSGWAAIISRMWCMMASFSVRPPEAKEIQGQKFHPPRSNVNVCNGSKADIRPVAPLEHLYVHVGHQRAEVGQISSQRRSTAALEGISARARLTARCSRPGCLLPRGPTPDRSCLLFAPLLGPTVAHGSAPIVRLADCLKLARTRAPHC